MAKGKEMTTTTTTTTTTTKSSFRSNLFWNSDNFNIKNNIRLTTLFLLLLIGNFRLVL